MGIFKWLKEKLGINNLQKRILRISDYQDLQRKTLYELRESLNIEQNKNKQFKKDIQIMLLCYLR